MSATEPFPTLLASAEVARDVLTQLVERQANAEKMLAQCALRALIDGAPVDEILAATGFQHTEDPADAEDSFFGDEMMGMAALMGRTYRKPTARNMLADRLAAEVRSMVLEAS